MLQVLSNLKEGPFSQELYDLSMAEVSLGRLSGPFSVDELPLSEVSIASRFGVEQGSHM